MTKCWNGMHGAPYGETGRHGRSHKKNGYGWGAGILIVVLASPAQAQVAPTPPNSGQILRQIEQAPQSLPPQAPLKLDVQNAAQSVLQAPPTAKFRVTGFRIQGNTVYPEARLQPLLHDAIGRDLDLAGLEEVAARITGYYRDHGFLLARAYLPAQDIHDGVVAIAILEGRYDKIVVHNESLVRDWAADMPLHVLQPGDVVQTQRLESALLLTGDLAGVGDVASTLHPGSTVGTSQLDVAIPADRRVSGSVSLDNYGNRYTGGDRLGASLAVRSPLGIGDLFNVDGLVSDEHQYYGRASYQVPVGSYGTQIGAAYSALRYSLGKEFDQLDAHGTARTVGGFLTQPLIRRRDFNLSARIGVDKVELIDKIDLYGTRNARNLLNWTLSLNGNLRDGFGGGGVTSFSVSYLTGQLDFHDPLSKELDAISAHTEGHFQVWNFSLLRLQRLTDRFSLYGAFQAQVASKNLDSAEQFQLGGAYGVRGYPQGEGNGDQGYLATLELRYALTPAWQLAGFYDVGHVTISKDPWTSDVNSRTLGDVGVAVRWNYAAHWSVDSALAWRVAGGTPDSGPDHNPRVWIRGSYYF
ncbi:MULTISPECIES: ShlB/FhaC/HecB family hemolysin secretion/activation protein [Paraburkholderia]|uniref:ShlB/FhaC/HecB family hemolysin secretion/activation protein n=1 Tax=Paraburkholderia TaxID=1822464 RepID=UPI002258F44E|nr:MULTISPECIES: ShlB/FhaC/HecB family hemolysin secretion/activation protein [Paraburkholderia]MCX4160048.1 ShlB/FhaC/HecB family hemolysin secretion/activation protein [Paraburkholderia megapolitana]MDN7155548.1 ShlB/FhaC/HecB family hemolysin secretion/activation protein [Paraburkholderia sp. CHISQ3]MDQ6492592.1 ShlB/FhaC/HecB family hemolysin secretion/activation protein [Paraburkholderia megapolitana]